jgi:RNA polymerase sigma factor (sigma-70 family)
MEHMALATEAQLAETIRLQRSRLARFIRRHIADAADAEDILQDVFYEFVLAFRLMQPVEQAAAWLFRVARNRITDFLRKKRPDPLPVDADGQPLSVEELLPSPHAGPDAAYARKVLLEALADAIDDLPPNQRSVFLAHEVEGRSFQDLAAETGVSVNTLLSRKHYAVARLRLRLRAIYQEWNGE